MVTKIELNLKVFIKFRNFILRKNVLAWYIIVACKGLNLQKILSGTGKGRITYSRGVASTPANM